MGRILNSNTHETEGRIIAERYHLLNHHVVRRILTCPKPSSSASPSIDPKEASYLLILFLNESIWDRVADIAVQSTKRARLEMDVNKRKPIKSTPAPLGRPDEAPELPQGASFHALAFLVALALRKSDS